MQDKFIEFLQKSGNLNDFYKLIDSKNYDQIYNLYGGEVYRKYTPVDVQKKDIEKCFANRDYESLRKKYGKIYNTRIKAYSIIDKIKLVKKDSLKKVVAVGLAALSLGSCAANENNLSTENSNSSISYSVDTENINVDLEENEDASKDLETTTESIIEETNEDVSNEEVSNYVYEDDKLNLNEKKNYNLMVEANEYIENDNKKLYDDIYSLNQDNYLNTGYCAFYDMPFLANISLYNSKVEQWNIDLYKNYLDEYNMHLEEYASSVRSMDLDDSQVITKVMSDIWASVEDGVGQGKYDIYGLNRIDIDKEDTSALCRNLVDDFSAKMNAIDPNYEAVNVCVNCDLSDYANEDFGNIRKYYAKNSELYADEKFIDIPLELSKNLKDNSGNDIAYKVDKFSASNVRPENSYYVTVSGTGDVSDYIGNHMVSMISIKDEETNELKYNLLVDVSNVNISVLKDGKIYVLSNENYEGLELSATGTIIFSSFDETQTVAKALVNSREHTEEIDLELLETMYGVDTINKNLAEFKMNGMNYSSSYVR